MKHFIVIDMQNDFCTGALKNDAAVAIIPRIKAELQAAKAFIPTSATVNVKLGLGIVTLEGIVILPAYVLSIAEFVPSPT